MNKIIMLKKIVSFILGVFLCSNSLTFMIIYLNLLKMGYSFSDYLKYISSSLECLTFIIGVPLIIYSLKKKYKKIKIDKTIIRRNI